MSQVNININATDNVSPILSRLQSQINQLQNSTRNINVGGGGGLGGGGGSIVGQIAAGNILANVYTKIAKLALDFSVNSTKAFMELEKTQRTFAFAMGKSAGELAKLGGEIERLRIVKFANEFGISATSASEDFGKFAAAVKGSNISLSEAEVIFKGVTKASATFGLGAEQTQRIFKALTDIVSKGKLQSQELVQQLGNNLPGATNLFARSLGITSSKLRELMKDGKITSEMLVKFGTYLDQVYDKSARGNLDTLQGQLNLLTNSFTELQQTLGEGLAPGLTKAIEALKTIVDGARDIYEKSLGISEETKVTRELADNFENTPEGKKAKSLAKNPKALAAYATELSDNLAKQTVTDFRKIVDENSTTDVLKFLTTEEQNRFTEYFNTDKSKQTPEYESDIAKMTLDRLAKIKEKPPEATLQDIAVSGERNLLMEVGKVTYDYLGNVVRRAAENVGLIEQPQVEQVTSGDIPNKALIQNRTRNKGISELVAKAAADAEANNPTGEGEGADKDKLKTDYHTPKILNINILTGDGASMISGNIQTDINTMQADSADIRQNVKDQVLASLNDMVNDTAVALARVAKSTGVA
jgi:tape measure domain-containing protein